MFHAVILFVDFSAFLVEPPLRIRITVDLIDEFPSRIAQPSHPIEIQRVSGKGFGGAEDRFPVHQRLRRFEFHPRTFENGGDYEIRFSSSAFGRCSFFSVSNPLPIIKISAFT